VADKTSAFRLAMAPEAAVAAVSHEGRAGGELALVAAVSHEGRGGG